MAIPIYLAMTAEEFSFCRERPPFIAWMACHFSPYGKGLTNLPPRLPGNSIVILNDRIPWRGHDAELICRQLESIRCAGYLLDFQRKDTPPSFTQTLVASLPYPVCTAEEHTGSGAVLVPPCPPHIPLQKHLKPWQGRNIWLEVSLDQCALRITSKGAERIPPTLQGQYPHCSPALTCHYGFTANESAVEFNFCRTREDLAGLAEQAQSSGVQYLIGLYQELK